MDASPKASAAALRAAAADFRTTHWSQVLEAGHDANPGAGAALARLCHIYWYPLYACVRRRGYSPEEAQDLTQDFFARLLERRVLQVADPARGRFRSFLLTALGNFLNNQWDRSRTLKRGAGVQIVSWDAALAEDRYLTEPSHVETPERIFERRWALTVMQQALAAVQEEYARAGKEALFQALQSSLAGGAAESYAALGARLGLSEGALKVAVHRLRRRYALRVREAIAQTLGPGEDVDDELRQLLASLK